MGILYTPIQPRFHTPGSNLRVPRWRHCTRSHKIRQRAERIIFHIYLFFIFRQQTKKKVAKVDLEKCRSRISKCNKGQCSDEADPICGNDAQTYKNQCQLEQATCLYVLKCDVERWLNGFKGAITATTKGIVVKKSTPVPAVISRIIYSFYFFIFWPEFSMIRNLPFKIIKKKLTQR